MLVEPAQAWESVAQETRDPELRANLLHRRMAQRKHGGETPC